MYTFRNYCEEDRDLLLNDGTTKLFLSSEGTMDDVSPAILVFLQYMNGIKVSDSFVTELDEYIKEIKTKEEERVSYMTYEMKLREAHDDGKAEGRKEGRKEERKDGILALIAAAKDFSASPAQAMEQLMKRYSLTEAEAQAAVQANW